MAVLARLPALEDGRLPRLDGCCVRQVEGVVGIELLSVAAAITAGLVRKAGGAVDVDGLASRCMWHDVEGDAGRDGRACVRRTRKWRWSHSLGERPGVHINLCQNAHHKRHAMHLVTAMGTAKLVAAWAADGGHAMCGRFVVVAVSSSVVASSEPWDPKPYVRIGYQHVLAKQNVCA